MPMPAAKSCNDEAARQMDNVEKKVGPLGIVTPVYSFHCLPDTVNLRGVKNK